MQHHDNSYYYSAWLEWCLQVFNLRIQLPYGLVVLDCSVKSSTKEVTERNQHQQQSHQLQACPRLMLSDPCILAIYGRRCSGYMQHKSPTFT